MSERWSKLQRDIYNLIEKDLDLQIHCSIYRMNSQYGSTDLPRYWITLGREIIWDYPKDFLNQKLSDYGRKRPRPEYQIVGQVYPVMSDISSISEMIRDYINTPLPGLLDHPFEFDTWGLTDILKAADRRIGRNKLAEHFFNTENTAVKKILQVRIHPYFMRSERIGFSHWTENDLPLAQSLWGDPDVTKFITASGVFSPDEIKARLLKEMQNEKEYGVQYWPIFLLENGEFAGVCGLRPHGAEKEFEIGFHLMKNFWNQGIATEAAKRVIQYAFEKLGAESIFAGHNPQNMNSAKVMTKLGFHFIGTEYYPPTGLMHPSYRLIREDYFSLE